MNPKTTDVTPKNNYLHTNKEQNGLDEGIKACKHSHDTQIGVSMKTKDVAPLKDNPILGLPKDFDAAVDVACKQPNLLDALVVIAYWNMQRMVEQASEKVDMGEVYRPETTFKSSFEAVMDRFPTQEVPKIGDNMLVRAISKPLTSGTNVRDKEAIAHSMTDKHYTAKLDD